jgi:hypothetical protein
MQDALLTSMDEKSMNVSTGTTSGEIIDLWGGAAEVVPPRGSATLGQISGQIDAGQGAVIYPWFQIITAMTSGGSATVDFQLQMDDTSAFSTPTVLWSTGATAFNNAAFAAGKKLSPPPLAPGAVTERYIRWAAVVAVAATTGGTVSGGLGVEYEHRGTAY